MQSENSRSTSAIGRWMVYAAWIIFLGMLTVFFNEALEERNNPNRQLLESRDATGSYQVTLKRNPYGHYVTSGQINGQPVTFLLDTGASNISIPERVAQRLGLRRGAPYSVATANGSIRVYSTTLDSVAVGPLKITGLRGGINPHMSGDEILLGMNYLKHLELIQRGDELILKYPSHPM